MLGGAGIVDQHVEAAPGCGRARNLLAVLIARHVALHHHDFGAGAAAEIGGGFGFRLAVGIVDDDARAALGQNGGGRGPEARGRTGDNRAQTILRHPHFLLLLLLLLLAGFRTARSQAEAYHIARPTACKSAIVPLCGIYSLHDDLHAALAGRPAESACQGYGFCSSLSARKDRSPRPWRYAPARAGANQYRG